MEVPIERDSGERYAVVSPAVETTEPLDKPCDRKGAGGTGDEVEIALAGDAVVLVRDAVLESVVPVGWPPLKETFQKAVQLGIPIYV